MSDRSDSALVSDCLNGDADAFEYLVARYEKPIFNLARRMVRDSEDAMDIAQTVFVKTYENLGSYDPAHGFFSWIYRIAIHESLNWSKRAKRVDRYQSALLDEGGGAFPAMEFTPEEEFGANELSDHIGEALRQLTFEYRIVLILKHYHDFSYQRMAEVLHIPKKKVKSRLFTARQQLREVLQREGIVQ